MKKIKTIFNDWLTRQRNRSKAKKEAVLRVQAKEVIQVREFNGVVYFAYHNVPLLRVEDIRTSIADTLTGIRDTYVKYMEE